MKILVADDERLIRYGVRSMLEEIGIPLSCIRLAADGEECVQAVRSEPPDLALVDIRMPRLDGLGVIDRCRPTSPDTHWVILTSHTSFDYARRAIQLGVEDYLLKPVRPADLAAVVAKTADKLRTGSLRRNEEFQVRISSVLHNTRSLDGGTEEPAGRVHYQASLLLFDTTLDEHDLLRSQLRVCERIRASIAAAVGPAFRLALCTLPVGYLALIGAWSPEAGGETAGPLGPFLTRVETWVSANLPEVRLTQVLCPETSDLAELLGALGRASEVSASRVTLGLGGQHGLDALEREQADKTRRELGEAAVALAAAHRARSRLAYRSELARLTRIVGADPAGRWPVAFIGATISGLAGVSDRDIRGDLDRAGDQLVEEDRSPALVNQVVAVVRSSYARDLGIGQIAADLGVTPNYLSTLFHRTQGITFVKYVTRLRMERARELLGTGCQVQVAARQVGYASVRHFSRLFQKEYGVPPSAAVEKKAAQS